MRDKHNGALMNSCDISVVVPVFNEKENIPGLAEQLARVMGTITDSYEIVFVDDGSRDGSSDVLKELHGANQRIKVVRLERNYGQHAATLAGVKHAKGSLIITMDSDIQVSPEDIPKLLEKMKEGYDVVSGARINRADSLIFRRIPSKIINHIAGKMTGIKLRDYASTFKVHKREVFKNINTYEAMARYLPIYVAWRRFSIAEVDVVHHTRERGVPNYNWARLIRLLFDWYLTYSQGIKTTIILISSGMFLCLIGSALLIVNLVGYLTVNSNFFNMVLITSILLVFLGVNLVSLSIISEKISLIDKKVKRYPLYIVREILD